MLSSGSPDDIPQPDPNDPEPPKIPDSTGDEIAPASTPAENHSGRTESYISTDQLLAPASPDVAPKGAMPLRPMRPPGRFPTPPEGLEPCTPPSRKTKHSRDRAMGVTPITAPGHIELTPITGPKHNEDDDAGDGEEYECVDDDDPALFDDAWEREQEDAA